MDKILEKPSFKAIVGLIVFMIAGVLGAIPIAHGYILQDIEISVSKKMHSVERDILSLKAQTELNHQLLMQEFKLFKTQQDEINKKVDNLLGRR